MTINIGDKIMNILDRISRASFDQWFLFIILSFLAAMATTVIIMVTHDHKIRCYYMRSSSTSAGIAYAVIGDVDWGDDVYSFSSADPDKALEVMSGLKQCAGND